MTSSLGATGPLPVEQDVERGTAHRSAARGAASGFAAVQNRSSWRSVARIPISLHVVAFAADALHDYRSTTHSVQWYLPCPELLGLLSDMGALGARPGPRIWDTAKVWAAHYC